MEDKYNPIKIHGQAWFKVYNPGENLQPDEEALYKDKDRLGKVSVRYRNKEITWNSFEDFWK